MATQENKRKLKPNARARIKKNFEEELKRFLQSKYKDKWEDIFNYYKQNMFSKLKQLAKNNIELEAYYDANQDVVVIFYPKEMIEIKNDRVILAAVVPKAIVELIEMQ